MVKCVGLLFIIVVVDYFKEMIEEVLVNWGVVEDVDDIVGGWGLYLVISLLYLYFVIIYMD